MKTLLSAFFLTFLLVGQGWSKSGECTGHFVDPISDVCWDCMLPITIGKLPVAASRFPDTYNPSMPISFCPKPPPIFMQIGINIGYWEPDTLVDITRKPYCMVNMGAEFGGGEAKDMGGDTTSHHNKKGSDGVFYQAHWYKYPLMLWLQLIDSVACMATDEFDLAYMTELDPFWDDDELSFTLNPESILFGNPATQLACVADAMKTSVGKFLPIDALFWCMGSQGSAYPLTGNSAYKQSSVSVATLIAERFNFKLHREGIVWESHGETGAICYQTPMPMLPKSRWRYQMVNTIPSAARCFPYGTTTAIWESGHDNPTTGQNFGFLNFKKRNCVFI